MKPEPVGSGNGADHLLRGVARILGSMPSPKETTEDLAACVETLAQAIEVLAETVARPRRFAIFDGLGRERIVLEAPGSGLDGGPEYSDGPEVRLLDDHGHAQAELTPRLLRILDQDGYARVKVALEEHGPAVRLCDPSGIQRVALAVAGIGSFQDDFDDAHL
ncbi:MAG: hypothetical protein KGR26_10285 [Cyanobacteria bacterium REEB65]|nr:hypothetical protein [Cyanobacteria bacterium REEB65]